MEGQPTTRSGLLFIALLAVAVAAVAIYSFAGGDRGASSSQPDGEGASATTGPTSAPTWHRPRFTARQDDRDAMVRVLCAYHRPRVSDKAVIAAMTAVPRHEFVPQDDGSLALAYADRPLPIGHGQTISQPYIVAYMTQELKLTAGSRVLEIGTGSGYQAAVLAELTPHVFSIEIVKPLAEAAAKRLKRLGYTVVRTRHADGYYGWKDQGPFDAIIVTCAAGQVPPPLIQQLKPGGRMVIPVGGGFAGQSLMLVTKDADGKVRSRSLMGVIFVPLTRKDVTAEK